MKKNLLQVLLFVAGIVIYSNANAQSVQVTKTNPMKLYMHYMPWFDAPENPIAGTNYSWGYHWKMHTKNPNIIEANGQRQIASHYYPLIGPYASKDPAVIEYHLLLMKLSGVDGLLIDWYGKTGSNGDINSLLENSDSLINRTAGTGMEFAIITEDRFWRNVQDGKNAMAYARDNYFNKPNYIHVDATSGPMVGVFGPVTFHSENEWTQIFSEVGGPVQFLTLDNHSHQVGVNADGEYMWVYNHFIDGLNNFYINKAPQLKYAMGAIYPRFNDYYAQGGAGSSFFHIPDNNGKTLDTTIALANKHKANIESVQLITFNDFGEGTMLEPTVETGFTDLVKIQKYTGVSYTQSDLEQVHKLYTLRKKYLGNAAKQSQLDQVFNYFTTLKIDEAVALMFDIESPNPLLPIISVASAGSPSEGGNTGTFTVSATNITSDVVVKYGIDGTAVTNDYTANPAFANTVVLTSAAPSVTITITPVDDAEIDPNETINLTLTADETYRILKVNAALVITDNDLSTCSGTMIVNASAQPVIEGAIDAAWLKAPANTIAKRVSGVLQADYAATWRAMHDSNYLYIFVEVKDSALKRDGMQLWENDAVEIYIDTKNEKTTAYDANDFQYGFRWGVGTDNPTTANMYGTAKRTGIEYAIPAVKGGYNLEVKIPWRAINEDALFAGKEIGFDVEINDNDKNATRQAASGWFASTDNAYTKPSVFGTVPVIVCTGEMPLAMPVIINVDSVIAISDSLFKCQILASNSPTSYSATGLPKGLTVNSATGVISGTPSVVGIFDVTIKANNTVGTASKRLVIKSVVEKPVTYTFVDAKRLAAVVNITWNVSYQAAVKEYQVEKSTDGINFNRLTTVGNNGNAAIAYQITDDNPKTSINYYRIKAIGFDNNIKISKVVKTTNYSLDIYPNPFNGGTLNLRFNNAVAERYQVRLMNNSGLVVYTTAINVSAGNISYPLNITEKYPPGFYQIELIGTSGHKVKEKIIIQ